jgi:hypothetical protein
MSDAWRLVEFFFEGPDTQTQKLLKYKGCNYPNCYMRTPHSHGMARACVKKKGRKKKRMAGAAGIPTETGQEEELQGLLNM